MGTVPDRAAGLSVFVVDDDASVRDSLGLMLGLAGYTAGRFSDAESFLAAYEESWAGCVVADLRLPRLSGVELLERMRERGSALPFVIITAHGDVPAARSAFRAQAVDFIEKPFDDVQLMHAIRTAFALEERRIDKAQMRRADREKLERLTPRERDVLRCAVRGLHAKEIATELGISPRTVEVHKTRIMEKLDVRNIAELVRFAIAAERGGE